MLLRRLGSVRPRPVTARRARRSRSDGECTAGSPPRPGLRAAGAQCSRRGRDPFPPASSRPRLLDLSVHRRICTRPFQAEILLLRPYPDPSPAFPSLSAPWGSLSVPPAPLRAPVSCYLCLRASSLRSLSSLGPWTSRLGFLSLLRQRLSGLGSLVTSLRSSSLRSLSLSTYAPAMGPFPVTTCAPPVWGLCRYLSVCTSRLKLLSLPFQFWFGFCPISACASLELRSLSLLHLGPSRFGAQSSLPAL